MNLQPGHRNWVDAAVRWFRVRRMQRFVAQMGVTAATRVLDVGGTPLNWSLCPVRPRVTLLNLPRAADPAPAGFSVVFGDGCRLPFSDQSFDIVFSNSVIEHIPGEAARQEFAREVRRVGKAYWVQTPCRSFPVEPHLWTPLVHRLPRSWQAAIVRRGTLWEWLERPSEDRRSYYLDHYLRDIRLLGVREMAALFPAARILRERLLGWTKSLIAVFP
ncbi:MAG: class I SAM-dependent methyltransferase [Bryobacteraceae bacterium]|nr:class I SAM-dependent methyltransferase [Bryobacteraceae bacterium]